MSWTEDELNNLTDLRNHKIIYDGYSYRWYSKPLDKWKLQSLKYFDSYNKPISWIHFNIDLWRKEADKRNRKYIRRMKRSLKIDLRINEIKKDYSKKTKNKVNEIISLKPEITNLEIAEILGITQRTVRRIRN